MPGRRGVDRKCEYNLGLLVLEMEIERGRREWVIYLINKIEHAAVTELLADIPEWIVQCIDWPVLKPLRSRSECREVWKSVNPDLAPV